MRELDTSGPTPLATVKLESGGTKYVRLYVREDGVVVAKDMLDTPANSHYRERPIEEDFYLDPRGEWVYRWSDERRVLKPADSQPEENLAAQVQEARRLLAADDRVGAIAYLLGRTETEVRDVLPPFGQPEVSGEAGTVIRPAGSEEPTT